MSCGDPEIYQQEIDWKTLDDILLDISAAATLLGVVVKGAPESYARGGGSDLAGAVSALRAGATGIQMRYVFQGVEWWDTILRDGDRLTVVRTRPPQA